MTQAALDAVNAALETKRASERTSYLIAFMGKPKDGEFLKQIVALSAGDGVEILGAVVTPGPGCHNLAVLLCEPNERYINALTMALMPAKWCTTTDPRLVAGQFIDEVQHA